MRRTDKEITDRSQIDAIIRGSLVCRVAMARDHLPYIVPLSFGYDGSALYFHTARQGKKIEHFLTNPQVCFEFERNVEVRSHPDLACKWSLNYESVIGYGSIAELLEPVAREHALNQIMRQYSGKDWPFEPSSLSNVRLWKLTITALSGKRSQPKLV